MLAPNPVSTLYSMLRHPDVGREQLVAFQNERVCRLVAHAYRHVPYYRGLFDRHGLKPQDIQTVDDLGAVPITSRSDLQALPVDEIIARNVDPGSLITRASSGSSGRPFIVRRTWLEERLHGAFRWRALHALGLRASDKICYVMGNWNIQRQNQLAKRILDTLGMARRKVIDALQPPEDIVQALQKFKPTVVGGVSRRVGQDRADCESRRTTVPSTQLCESRWRSPDATHAPTDSGRVFRASL